jgi:putative ABC transport system permease protein
MRRTAFKAIVSSQLDILWRDLRDTFRLLHRFPHLTAAVIVTLAVGVGVNSVVFSLFNGLLFRANVSRDPETFVQVYAKPSGDWRREIHGTPYMLTLEEFELIRRNTRSLSAVTVSQWTFLTLGDAERSDFRGKYVSCNHLTAHVRPMLLGRGFVESDCAAPGVQPVIVLTERGWTLRFGRDPHVIGRTLRLNGQAVTVIGVAPDDPAGDPVAALYFLPYTMKSVIHPAEPVFRDPPSRHAWLSLSGRLAPHMTLRDVQHELDGIAASLNQSRPGTLSFLVTNGALISEPGTARRMPLLIALCLGSAALILLMICATVATLLLARAVGRRHEMAIRLSLGASRPRLLRQLLTESVVLSLAAGAIGLGLACYLPDRIAAMLTEWPIAVSLGPDWRVLGYTFGLAVVAGCVAGLSPAVESMRLQLTDALKPQGQGDGRPSSTTLRGMLIADQLAISLALLVAMGLVARAQSRLATLDPGYDPNSTVALRLDLARFGYTPGAARQFRDRFLPRVSAMPGVTRVALSSPAPFRGQPRVVIRTEGTVRNLSAVFRVVSPGYFAMTNVRLTRGRLFDEDDGWIRGSGTGTGPGRGIPVVVSESFAKSLWPGLDPLGRQLNLTNGQLCEVVGVVTDTSSVRPGEADDPLLYQPPSPGGMTELSVLVQFTGDPRPLIQALRQEVRTLDSRLLGTPETIASIIAQEADRYSTIVALTALPSGLAVFLALVGVYGVTSFAAVQRRHEVGVRITLGARPHEIIGLLLKSLRWPLSAGLLIGIPLAALSANLLQRNNLLAGIEPLDPWIFGGAIMLVAIAAGVATLIPALRVARVDPSRVLNSN